MFKFLHTADIHLDSPLRGLDRYEGAPAEEIRGASRVALANLVDLAIRERVAFVVIAGDLYDGDWRDHNTGLRFAREMVRLREAEIPVFGVYGNHDAASKITRELRLPANVAFFSTDAAESMRVEAFDVVLHGQSFQDRCTKKDLAKNYPAAESGCFNLGILHTSMTGREGHDSYAPCSESCLRESGYDYWALGHIHVRDVLRGTPTIAYPGNIQGRHIGETGSKGCLVVEVADNREVTTRFEPLDVMRWQSVEVVVNDMEQKPAVIDRVETKLKEVVDEASGRLVAARVVLRGSTTLATDLAANPRQWTADVRALALDVARDGLWIEQVSNKTMLPELYREDASLDGADDTPLAELLATVDELLAASEIDEGLQSSLADLRNKLPRELSSAMPIDDHQWWQGVLAEATAKLRHELGG